MKRPVLSLICTLLLASFPVTSLFAQNQTEVERNVLWLPLAVSVVAAVLYALCLLLTSKPAKSGVLVSLVVVAVFYYGFFADSAPRWFVVLWLALLLVGLIATVRTRRQLGPLVLMLGVAALVTSLPSLVSIALFAARHPGVSAADPRLWPTALAPPAAAAGTPRPDIYVLIPDD